MNLAPLTATDTTITITGNLPASIREPIAQWAREHGIDPDRVPIACTIERNPWAKSITVDEYLTRGGVPVILDGARTTRRVTHHLDAPPAPFPQVVLDADGSEWTYTDDEDEDES